jgi:ABC-type Zn uptake system ZnuABC Zn-binding protein ZnuA
MRILLSAILLGATLSQLTAQIKVISSASIFADMAKEIGGDKIVSESIVPVGSDPHTYEPTPSDVGLIRSADLILVNGLTFEEWINSLIDNSGTTAPKVTITAGIDAIQSDKYANAYDPHAWMDARHGLQYVDNILAALIKVDPSNTAYYQARHQRYRKEIRDLDKYISDAIQTIPADRRVLITSHDAFAYYGQRYGLELNAIMGISTEAEARTSDIVRVSKAIKTTGIPAIFVESTINPKLIEQIAKDSDIVVGGELYADSIGKKGSEGDSYTKMLRHNTDVIVQALSRERVSPTTGEDGSTSSMSNVYLLVLGLLLLLLIGGVILLRR